MKVSGIRKRINSDFIRLFDSSSNGRVVFLTKIRIYVCARTLERIDRTPFDVKELFIAREYKSQPTSIQEFYNTFSFYIDQTSLLRQFHLLGKMIVQDVPLRIMGIPS